MPQDTNSMYGLYEGPRSVTFHRLTQTSAVHGNKNREVGLGSSLRECLLSAHCEKIRGWCLRSPLPPWPPQGG